MRLHLHLPLHWAPDACSKTDVSFVGTITLAIDSFFLPPSLNVFTVSRRFGMRTASLWRST